MRNAAMVLSALLLSSCMFRHGERLQDVTPATTKRGVIAEVTLRINESRYVGELLLATDSQLYLLQQGVANPKVFEFDMRDLVRARIGKLELDPPLFEPGRLRQIRHRSRYARGLTAAQLQEVLSAYGQTAPTIIKAHVDSFLQQVQAATASLATISAAIGAGYRRLGPSFPGMGTHWINPGLVVAGMVDASRPPVLCFARIGDRDKLIAVAFTMPLRPGEQPPGTARSRGVARSHGNRRCRVGAACASAFCARDGTW